MRPTARARVSSSGSDTDLDSDTQASLVLLGNPASELSTDSETPALNALSALSSLPRPAASPRHSPPRTRRVKLCSIVSVISEEGLETFEKQELRDLIRSNSDSKFQHEIFTKIPRVQDMAETSKEKDHGGHNK